MTVSLAVTVVNLGIGAVSRIPAENIASSSDPYVDAVLFKILVILANTLVIGLVVGNIILFLLIRLVDQCKLSYLVFTFDPRLSIADLNF